MRKNKFYNVFVFLPNHRDLGKYVAGFIRLEKWISTGAIISIQYGKTFNQNYSLREAKNLLANAIKNIDNAYIDYILTNNKLDFARTSLVVRDVYDIKNQHELITKYIAVQENIKQGVSKVSPKKINLGNGVMLHQSEKTKLIIDYGNIQTYVVATMLAIDLVSKDNNIKLLQYYEENEKD